MIELYAAALILGGGLAVTGAIGAAMGHATDASDAADSHTTGLVDHPGHLDLPVHHGHPGHAADAIHAPAGTSRVLDALFAVIPALSLRFWTYALATFGMIGMILTWLSDASRTFVLIAAIVLGVVVGRITHAVFRAVRRLETSGGGSSEQFVGRDATVVVAITPGTTGKISLHLSSGTVELLADAFEDEHLLAGSTVVVVAFRAERALVMSSERFRLPSPPPPRSLPHEGTP